MAFFISGMSSNGIEASSGASDNDAASPDDTSGCCSLCVKEIIGIKSAVAWETMIYCDENCLGKYQDRMNNCSTCKVHVQTAFLGKIFQIKLKILVILYNKLFNVKDFEKDTKQSFRSMG